MAIFNKPGGSIARTVFGVALILTFLCLFSSCTNKQERNQTNQEAEDTLSSAVEESFVKGIYGNPAGLLKAGHSLRGLGINAIFVHRGSINEELMVTAKKEGLKVYAEFPLLNGKDYLKDNEEAWPIDSNGNKSPKADWFMGICPNNPDFKDFRRQQLSDLMGKFDLDGVWLDYVHWHAQFEDPEPILPETCFCEHCLKKFSDDTGLIIPEGNVKSRASWILSNEDSQWRAWRRDVIIEWVAEFKNLLNEHKPGALLGVYYCPWYPEEYDSAEYRILGLDHAALYKTADVLSPMIYHGRMGRKPTWTKEFLQWFNEEIVSKNGKGAAIWPIIQASDEPVRISPEEFRQVMIDATAPPSTGVMMFSTGALNEDPEKVEVMKQIYVGKTTP